LNHDVDNPDQYLRDAHGRVKLNDFNNAEILDWNVKSNKAYCKTDRGAWGGMYRAPEEFRGDYIDEQIDVYALGNNLYTLLTGLWPFYEDKPYGVVQKKIHAKQRPFIDDRYRQGHFIEQRFIHLMEQCWEHRAEDRPSVFQVLAALRRLNETYWRTKQR
jgi:serine/threonine protein kinase